jgi:TetR/AcrR family transcriptional regulator
MATRRTQRTTQERGAATRDAILAAAARVFAQQGLDGARTEAIASKARVNKAMLYYYFKSKDALYAAVLESYFKEFHRRAIEVLDSDAAPGATVLRFVETHFDFLASERDYPMLFQRLILMGSGRFERLIRRYMAPVSRKLIEVIEAGQRSGEFRRADSRHAAISIVAVNVFYFSAAPVARIAARLDAYSPANLKVRKDEVLDFVRHALFQDPESRPARLRG